MYSGTTFQAVGKSDRNAETTVGLVEMNHCDRWCGKGEKVLTERVGVVAVE